MHDIAIVGGGPGGLCAAARLAARGFDVAVFEEHPTAGDPVHCTGVLAAEAFDEFDIPRSVVLNPLTTAEFFGPSGQSIEYTTSRPEALVIDRRAFDNALCEAASAAGASISVGARVTDVCVTESGVVVSLAEGCPVESRLVVLACGANYVFQRRLGLGLPPLYLQTAQIEVPALRPGHVELHFGGEIAPQGFAWVVPVYRGAQAFARVGLMCAREAREYFDRFLVKIGPRWGTGIGDRFDGGVVPRSKMLPLAPIPRTYCDRVIAIGDAAGLVKATTGGGIYYSLLSGTIAADVISGAIDAGDLSARKLADYERRWRAALDDELEAQITLRRIADRLSDEEIESLFELARTDGIMPIVRRTARFNRHRDLIVALLAHPPARRVFMRRVLGLTRQAVRSSA